jgi:hypothetical protein
MRVSHAPISVRVLVLINDPAAREEVEKLLAPELMTTNRKLGRVCIDTASAEEHEAGWCRLLRTSPRPKLYLLLLLCASV